MCDICHHSPCFPGCPNAPEPKGLVCKGCGGTIQVWDVYLEANDGRYCEDCLSEMPPGELLELVGESLSVVTEEDLEEI